MTLLDHLIALATILMICGFAGALGCVLADWRRYLRWFKKHVRWQWMTETWARWAP